MTTARPTRPPAVTAPAPGVTQVAGVAPTPRPTRTAPSPYRGSPASSWSADPYAEALRTGRGPLFLRRSDGWLLPLEVERWCAAADAADEGVLRRCEGPVLDIGCGPGRLVAALAAGGRPALGIDVSEAAVARTRRLGGQALRRSVFEPLPDEGRWGTVLLVDGNVGIGGDPVSLLARAGELLRPGGLLLAETVPGADVDERADVRLVREPYGAGGGAGAAGAAFPWARLGAPALLRYAARAGWRPAGQWSADGRLFVALRSRHRNSSALPPKSTAVISSQRPRNPSAESAVADR
ncbi:class I SAM-dependent methyltransferase [Streptomyces griseoaurantiacus]|uniref:class I SAM-dependent methyltransferase n=1 Tax=Streptomyces griseoaurantiacus TaxID=68213 RepID=UPI00345F44A1